MSERPHYSLAKLALYFLNLGSVGFGGPVALVGYMYRDLVEKRHWIAEEDYKEGLTLAQLMPGPLAAQLAMYLGYVDYRIMGGGRHRFCGAFLHYGGCDRLGVRALRWATLDAGGVLRRRRRGHRHHRH